MSDATMPEWVREEMAARGLDPARPLNDIDLGNRTVRDAVLADPTLSEKERQNILATGSPKAPRAQAQEEAKTPPRQIAAKQPDGTIVAAPSARVHSELLVEPNATYGYVVHDGHFLTLNEAAEHSAPEDRPPAYLKALRPFEECLGTIAEALEYRAKRIGAFKQLLQDQIGITREETERLSDLLARDASTDRFERTLSPEQRIRFNNFFEGPFNQRTGPFEDWTQDSRRDPSRLLWETEKPSLAEAIVEDLSKSTVPQFELSDRFLYPVVALLRLRELGGTWHDVSAAVVDKLHSMRAGNDSVELYEVYGKQIRRFAVEYGVDLPLDRETGRNTSVEMGLPPLGEPKPTNAIALAKELRSRWDGTSDPRARANILNEAGERLKDLRGPDLTGVPLRVAVRDYVRGAAELPLVERRAREHEAATARQISPRELKAERGHSR